ncbi:putative S-adenosylmethionine-dependent methyltransferase [compost metagenome]
MNYFKTEITSDHIVSDKPLHERLLFPYVQIAPQLKGEILELGCGWGRGVDYFQSNRISYTGVDKNKSLINDLRVKFPDCNFQEVTLPDLSAFASNSFDHIIAFQVIEHIEDDELFLEEIHRILRPGGKLHLSTINSRFSISRNPWHIREYDAIGLTVLLKMFFCTVDMKGIEGNELVWKYHFENRKSVNRIMRFDFFGLQYRLPAMFLRIPYELLNRLNRKKLICSQSGKFRDISWEYFHVNENPDLGLDLFVTCTKSQFYH